MPRNVLDVVGRNMGASELASLVATSKQMKDAYRGTLKARARRVSFDTQYFVRDVFGLVPFSMIVSKSIAKRPPLPVPGTPFRLERRHDADGVHMMFGYDGTVIIGSREYTVEVTVSGTETGYNVKCKVFESNGLEILRLWMSTDKKASETARSKYRLFPGSMTHKDAVHDAFQIKKTLEALGFEQKK